jgi:predicted extracellular nuclease
MTTAYFNLSSGNFFWDWSNIAAINAANDWSGVPSIIAYRGDGLSSSTSTNPGTLTANDTGRVVNVLHNQANPNTNTTGGIGEFQIADPTIALQGSGTADAPYLVLHLDATGREDVVLTFRARDIDGSGDNAVQQIAVQYRIGDTGTWTNLPAGYIADATTGPSTLGPDTNISVTLPPEVNGQSQLQIRIITNDAVGSDEWVGIDDIGVSSSANGAAPADVSIGDVTITEDDSGTQTATFTVTRSNANGDFTVDYATADDTATVGDNDYGAASGTLHFTVGGDLTQTVSVVINGDLDVEDTEAFFVNLSGVSNTTGTATISDGQAIGTITTDDFPPTVSIGDVSIVEGDSGTSMMTFTVTRTDGNTAFTVGYSTADGTATGLGDDYVSTSGTVTFTVGGPLTQTVMVPVFGDTAVEGDETLTVTLGAVSNTVGTTAVVDGTGAGTILNDDGLTKIYDIQGAGHASALVNTAVTTVGIVTAIDKDLNAYWIQDATGDGDRATSDGILVFVGGAIPSSIVVGAEVRVSGTVREFVPQAGDLTLTELGTITEQTVLSVDNDLPAAVIIGDTANGADVAPPLVNLGSATDAFDPTTDGADFWESLEGMRVTLQDVHTTSPFKTAFGEIMVTPDVGDNDSLNSRGGLTISDETHSTVDPADKVYDFNPERIQLDDEALGGSIGAVTSVGQTVVGGDVTGIVSYGFGFYDVNVTQAVDLNASTLVRETTTIEENLDRLTIATFNVRNLAPLGFNGGDGVTTQTTLNNLADAIGTNLKTPDIIGLQELQDFNGTSSTGNGDATLTMSQLIDTIFARTGVQYYGILSDPVDDQEGGAPGGNIQVAFLYQPDAVTPTAGNNLVETAPGSHIFKFPTADRIGDDGDPDFAATRSSVPIEFTPAGYTETQGGSFYVINNHFSSKGGSAVMIGANLDNEYYAEPLNADSVKREGQAIAVKAFIDGILADGNAMNDKIIALGDFNDFQIFPVIGLIQGIIERAQAGVGNTPSTFVPGTQILKALIELLPAEERYSYNFDGNAQALDQIIGTLNLVQGAIYDVIHINSEFASQLSDHDPGMVSLLFIRSAAIATEGDDVFDQASYIAKFGAVRGSLTGNDTVLALGGNDLIEGSAGADSLNGGAGIDTVDYTGSDAAVTVNLTTRAASGGWAAGDDLIAIENLIGSQYNDFLTGTAAANILDGGVGDDTLTGGTGNDTYRVDGADTVVELNNGGVDLVISTVTYTLGSFLENLTLGGTGDIDGTGNTANNALRGNDGANSLSGLGGVDQIFGGLGDDTLSGGDGNDVLDGQGGADHMEGGAGNDTYYVDDAGDTITEVSAVGLDTVRSSAANFTLGDYVENLVISGAGDLNATGSAQANVLTGNNSNNILSGMAGNDTLNGGLGSDTLDGGADNDKLYGGAGIDHLTGGAGSDTLDGGTGGDDMAGGDGADTYYIDNIDDTVIEAAGQGLDRIYTTIGFTLAAGQEVESLYVSGPVGLGITGNEIANKIYGGIGADTLDGGEGNDIILAGDGADHIIGGEGNDYLDGGIGADEIAGGAGNDTYLADSDDIIVELAGGGIDTIRIDTASYTLAAELENLILTGTGAGDVTGNAAANAITGNDAANQFDGLDGNDRLTGNGGADVLNGGAGLDILLGGDGDDYLVGGAGNDKMTGGAGLDTFASGDIAIAPVPKGALIETDNILDYEDGEVIELNTGLLVFQGAFNGTAGQATLAYTLATNTTLFSLDVDGDNRADYQIRFTGEVTEQTILVGGEPAGTGGWLLTG